MWCESDATRIGRQAKRSEFGALHHNPLGEVLHDPANCFDGERIYRSVEAIKWNLVSCSVFIHIKHQGSTS